MYSIKKVKVTPLSIYTVVNTSVKTPIPKIPFTLIQYSYWHFMWRTMKTNISTSSKCPKSMYTVYNVEISLYILWMSLILGKLITITDTNQMIHGELGDLKFNLWLWMKDHKARPNWLVVRWIRRSYFCDFNFFFKNGNILNI